MMQSGTTAAVGSQQAVEACAAAELVNEVRAAHPPTRLPGAPAQHPLTVRGCGATLAATSARMRRTVSYGRSSSSTSSSSVRWNRSRAVCGGLNGERVSEAEAARLLWSVEGMQ